MTADVGAPAPSGGIVVGTPTALSHDEGDANRAEWLEWRRHGLGGSDAAAVVGLSSYGSPFTVFASKVGLLPDSEPTRRQRVGQLLEPVIAALFHEDTGLHVVGEQTWCTHPELDWARCTVDGFGARSPQAVIGDLLGTHQAKSDARFGWPEVPVNIRAQCVWEMAVTGLEHCWLSVLHGGFQFKVYELDLGRRRRGLGLGPDARRRRAAVVRAHRHRGPTGDRRVRGHGPGAGGDLPGPRARRAGRPRRPGPRAHRARRGSRPPRPPPASGSPRSTTSSRAVFGTAEVGTLDGEAVLTYRTAHRKAYSVAESSYRALRAASKRNEP